MNSLYARHRLRFRHHFWLCFDSALAFHIIAEEVGKCRVKLPPCRGFFFMKCVEDRTFLVRMPHGPDGQYLSIVNFAEGDNSRTPGISAFVGVDIPNFLHRQKSKTDGTLQTGLVFFRKRLLSSFEFLLRTLAPDETAIIVGQE